MPADNERDPLDRWLDQQVRPLPPPPGTFELITRRARRRKIRKAVVTVASAAAVAAVVGIAVPVGMSLHLTTPSQGGSLAAGDKPAPGRQSALASGSHKASPSPSASPSASPSGSASRASGVTTPGYLPPDFSPISVTWDSLSTGWIMGPAGTAGKCANANPDICTSIARTDDGGQSWHGLPAPDAASPGDVTGVTQLRFLNASDGWAYGPELWATEDGGGTWHKAGTGGQSVTALEASEGRAYALFGDCPSGIDAGCTSYTLMTSVAGSDTWTEVAGLPASLTTAAGPAGGAVLTLAAPTATTGPFGFLAAPDGTLYAGPLDGSAWHKVTGTLPCSPQAAAGTDGTPPRLLLTSAGGSPSDAVRLGAVCADPGGGITTLQSDNAGTTWKAQPAGTVSGTTGIGTPASLTALGDGTLILATEASASATGGIYELSPGASGWQKSALSDPADAGDGFSYVGMTSATQGVAIGGSTGLHAIWMTSDGGKSWQLRPIKS
jgi:hypothetical protein